jgi:hypothetical protein
MNDWKKINDDDVLHVWVDDESNEEVNVSPDFYEENGEPCNDQGDVLRYSHTLIRTTDTH